MNIEPVTMYPCPETGKLFYSEEEAVKNAKKIKSGLKREKQRKLKIDQEAEQKAMKKDWLRLNLENIYDYEKLIVEKSKEFYGWDMTFSFKRIQFGCCISNSHSCPIGGVTNWWGKEDLPRGYPGWKGCVHANIFNKIKPIDNGWISSISDHIKANFSGIYFGTGIGGTPGNSSNSMSMDFVIWLDDYPKLKEKYEIYLDEHEKARQNKKLTYLHNNDAHDYGAKHDTTVQLRDQIIKLQQQEDDLRKILTEEYKNRNPIEGLQDLIPDYEDLHQMFK